MKIPKIHVIIVTYNAMKWAKKCFSSLRESSVPVEIIVVDNGSTDGTQNYIQSNFPEVDLILTNENLGFGKANNIGLEKAYKNGADFFYLMNQDAWIFEDSLGNLMDVYENYPNKEKVGILSPMHFDGTEQKLDIFLDKYIAQNFESRIISDLYFNSLKPFYEILFVNAAHWFLPKETIEKVGGFNPYFFHYGEDNEYVNRLHFHGKKILLCPNSKVVHDGKQVLSKVDYTTFKDLSVDTKILNPNIKNSLQQEKKALQQSILKNMLSGNFDNVKVSINNFKRIKMRSKELGLLTQKITTELHVFLDI